MSKSDRKPESHSPEVAERAPPSFILQRKCACGSGASALTSDCTGCEQKKLQRRAAGSAPREVPESVGGVLAATGAPLDPAARREMESRFGHDFGSVRIHTDAQAAESARSAGALAYTVGSHVVFGASQYAPSTRAGRHLLAHELTHTIQQRAGFKLQRQEAEVSSPTDAAEAEADRTAGAVVGGYLVEDDAQPGGGQMRKSAFLDELQSAVCAAADAELAAVGRSTDGCPYIAKALPRYRPMSAAKVESAVRRYVDPAGIAAARDYIPLVSRRVASGVARWATTGDTSAVPPELVAEFSGAAGTAAGIMSAAGEGLSGAVGAVGRLLFKRGGNAAATDAETTAASRLGKGVPLDGFVRGRMEQAFGFDFSSVRIHADARASAASSSLGARAFTIGRDIAFGGTEYRPNTPAGDALIAHELAHVAQQSGGVRTTGAASDALDEDADRSAVGAVMAIWTGTRRVASQAMPRLRSGLGLQRCSKAPDEKTQTLLALFAEKFPDAATLIAADKGAMELMKEATAAGVEFGGYAEDGPGASAWPYTIGNAVYIPKARTDAIVAMSDFLFELNNAVRKPLFAQNTKDAAAKKIDAKTFARKKVELEVEGMVRLGKIWFDIKKGDAKLDKYDNDFFLAEYQAYKDGTKTKENIIDDVLKWKNGIDPSKTNEEFYMGQYPK